MKRAAVLAGLAVLSVTLCAQPGLTQPSDELKALRRDFETLKEGQTTIQKELQEIKNLLRARPSAAAARAQEAVVSVDGAPFKGEKSAKVTLVDFTDYQ